MFSKWFSGALVVGLSAKYLIDTLNAQRLHLHSNAVQMGAVPPLARADSHSQRIAELLRRNRAIVQASRDLAKTSRILCITSRILIQQNADSWEFRRESVLDRQSRIEHRIDGIPLF